MSDMLSHFKVYPDFPKPGINFYDIQSALAMPAVWTMITEQLANLVRESGAEIVIGAESRALLPACR